MHLEWFLKIQQVSAPEYWETVKQLLREIKVFCAGYVLPEKSRPQPSWLTRYDWLWWYRVTQKHIDKCLDNFGKGHTSLAFLISQISTRRWWTESGWFRQVQCSFGQKLAPRLLTSGASLQARTRAKSDNSMHTVWIQWQWPYDLILCDCLAQILCVLYYMKINHIIKKCTHKMGSKLLIR